MAAEALRAVRVAAEAVGAMRAKKAAGGLGTYWKPLNISKRFENPNQGRLGERGGDDVECGWVEGGRGGRSAEGDLGGEGSEGVGGEGGEKYWKFLNTFKRLEKPSQEQQGGSRKVIV